MVAAGSAIANKLARERGNQLAADWGNRLSQSEILHDLITSNPQALGKWGAELAAAAARGPGALELQDWMLAQSNPEYAEQRRRAMGAEN